MEKKKKKKKIMFLRRRYKSLFNNHIKKTNIL